MKACFVTVASVVLVTGCATQPADPFAGTYRFADPKEHGQYLVERVGENMWSVIADDGGQTQTSTHKAEVIVSTLASPSLLAQWFDPQSPRGRITCLTSTGRYQAPSICHIPTDATFRMAEAMSQIRVQSKTGYVLVVGTSAGTVAADLARSK